MMLIGAMNPCPCGFFGDSQRACTCSPQTVTRYQRQLSGPLIDRIDIHLEVPRVDYEKLSDVRMGETSASIRGRVEAARERQRARFKGKQSAHATPRWGQPRCGISVAGDPPPRTCLRMAMQQLHLSARAYHRVLKLSRTIADLAERTRSARPTSPRRSSTGPGTGVSSYRRCRL